MVAKISKLYMSFISGCQNWASLYLCNSIKLYIETKPTNCIAAGGFSFMFLNGCFVSFY